MNVTAIHYKLIPMHSQGTTDMIINVTGELMDAKW